MIIISDFSFASGVSIAQHDTITDSESHIPASLCVY